VSGVYIPGMQMPKDGYRQVFITAEGKVFYYPSSPKNGVLQFEAIAIPEHGRLIDADAFKRRMMQGAIDAREDALTDEIWRRILDAAKSLCLDVDEQPTIIPASKDKEGCAGNEKKAGG
jgi:hypothetical protein